MSQFFYSDNKDLREEAFYCGRQTIYAISRQTSLLADQKHATFYTLVWEITVNEKLKIYGENWGNQSQMNSSVTKKCFESQRVNLQVFSALFLLFVGSGPIEKLGSSSLVSSIFQREEKIHWSFTGRKLWSQLKKCPRHLIYVQVSVNKDFVHSGSTGLI